MDDKLPAEQTVQRKKRHPAVLAAELLLLAALLAGAAALLRAGYRRYMTSAYPLLYTEFVEKYADEYGLTPSLVYALIRTESEFNPDAVSSAGAKGLMQLTDATFEWVQTRTPEKEELPVKELFDPETNIRYGTYYLLLLSQQFSEQDTFLAAYNAGPGRVKGWLENAAYSDDGLTLREIPYAETAGYVTAVKRSQEMYRELYDLP